MRLRRSPLQKKTRGSLALEHLPNSVRVTSRQPTNPLICIFKPDYIHSPMNSSVRVPLAIAPLVTDLTLLDFPNQFPALTPFPKNNLTVGIWNDIMASGIELPHSGTPLRLLNFTSIMFVLSLRATLAVAMPVSPPIEVELLNYPGKDAGFGLSLCLKRQGFFFGRCPNMHGESQSQSTQRTPRKTEGEHETCDDELR